jgi:hypothetical protein
VGFERSNLSENGWMIHATRRERIAFIAIKGENFGPFGFIGEKGVLKV